MWVAEFRRYARGSFRNVRTFDKQSQSGILLRLLLFLGPWATSTAEETGLTITSSSYTRRVTDWIYVLFLPYLRKWTRRVLRRNFQCETIIVTIIKFFSRYVYRHPLIENGRLISHGTNMRLKLGRGTVETLGTVDKCIYSLKSH